MKTEPAAPVATLSQPEEPKCETGCKHFYGGEIRHHPDCFYYPESLSKMLDDLQAAPATLSGEAQAEEWDAELRDAELVTYSDGQQALSGIIFNDKKKRFEDGEKVRTSLIQVQYADIYVTKNTRYKVQLATSAPTQRSGEVEALKELRESMGMYFTHNEHNVTVMGWMDKMDKILADHLEGSVPSRSIQTKTIAEAPRLQRNHILARWYDKSGWVSVYWEKYPLPELNNSNPCWLEYAEGRHLPDEEFCDFILPEQLEAALAEQHKGRDE